MIYIKMEVAMKFKDLYQQYLYHIIDNLLSNLPQKAIILGANYVDNYFVAICELDKEV